MGDPEQPDLHLRYRSLFDEHPDAVYELDPEGRFLDGNAALERLVGHSIEELRELSYLPFTHPDDVDHVAAEFARALGGESRTYEARGLHPDGHVVDLQITNLPIVVDGEVVGIYGIARDVTTEKLADRRLEESEARLRSTFETTSTGILVLSLEGVCLEANPAFASMVEVPRADLEEREVRALIDRQDRASLDVALRSLTSNGPPGGERSVTIGEIRFTTSSGAVAWGRTSLAIVPPTQDASPYLIAHIEDVTARHEAELRAAHGEALLKLATRIARVGGWVIDAATGEQHWSPEIHEILGFPPGATPPVEAGLELFTAPHRQRAREALRACLEDGTPFDLQAEMETVTGERLTVRTVAHAERDRDGTVTAVHGAFQDITDQVRATEESQVLARRLAQTMAAMSDGLGLLDEDWRVTYVNDAAARIVGRPADELIGIDLLEMFPELEGSDALAAYRRAMDERVVTTVGPFWFEPLKMWFEVRAYPSDPGIALYFRDVSEAMERESRLEEVAAREQAAAEQLRQLDRVKNTFLAAVSHELRTPLTVVRGMAQTLPRLRSELNLDVRNRIEDALSHHADRLAVLLDELLDLDRLSRGSLQTERRPIDATTIVRAVAARYDHDRIHLVVPERLEAELDAVQFERIVANLLDNAVKYARDGDIQVELHLTGNGQLRLEVIDDGPGIPVEQLAQVFEPFHRAAELGAQPGTGIGLALVAEFARLHDGDAWAEPTERGARLIVQLPSSRS